jgi:hypothetical protein|tara:strand:+ start:6 stop:182 length:177 start_codon:yes stop_codon:yes gene_type:complete
MDFLLARLDQLEKDKKKLLEENRELKRVLKEYDSTIVQRIMEGKDSKLKEYQEIRNKI